MALVERQGKAWKIQNQVGNKEIVLTEDQVNTKQSIHIYKCEDSVIKINGKVNEILIDNCKKVGVLFESVISSIDIVNSSKIQVEVTDEAPTVQVDKSHGVTIFLSKKSENLTSVITSSATEVNVMTTKTEGDQFFSQ